MDIKHESIFKEVVNSILRIVSKEEFTEVIWCGENNYLLLLTRILSSIGININTVLDNASEKIGIRTKYYSVYSYDVVNEKGNDAIYLICNEYADVIRTQLINLGIKKTRIYVLYPVSYTIIDFEERFRHDMYCNHRMNIKETQKCMLSIMDEFDKYCRDNGIRYYLYDGTLIGAIRHKGFIPWDDDLDVAVPYEDYVRLINGYKDNSKYSLISWERTNNYEFQWAKLIDNRTKLLHFGNSIIGCYIDIFPLGGYPNESYEIEKKWDEYSLVEDKWEAYNVLKYTNYSIKDRRKELIESLYTIPFDEAEFIGVMRIEKQKPWVAPVKWFEQIDLEFEGRIYKGPKGYDEYLTMKYGDYMVVPPVEKREMHGFEAYILDEGFNDNE